jgi:hypothetical protein
MGNKNSRSPFIRSRVVPFLPRFGEAGFCRVVVEAADVVVVDEEEFSEEALVMSVREEFGDAVKCEDESDGLENKP